MRAAGSARPSGRRGGESDTRGDIASAARRQFAELGFDRTSMRQVAREAGVDPALVSHFYGSKLGLFAETAQLPIDPVVVLPQVLAGPRDQVGLRLARLVVDVLTDEEGRSRVVALVRAAASEPAAAHVLRDRLTHDLLLPLAQSVGGPDPEYRAALVMAQVVGLTFARHVVALAPLASATPDDLVASLAPILQAHLVGHP